MADEFTKAALYGIKTFNKKVKEKIGMEKLVMLLDIYEEEVVGVHSVGEHITEKDEAWIISKKFGFIQWLVENDKINKFEINTRMIKSNRLYHGKDMTTVCRVDENLEKVLLMILSISDTPIEDLISYLR